jgi:gliding motility-associated-like protein
MKQKYPKLFGLILYCFFCINSDAQQYKDPDLLWGTYFGAAGLDNGHAITTDISGNLYITGSTSSSTGMATPGAFQENNGGNSDAYLAKFTNTGRLIWSTYFGGAGEDGGNAIALDASGNIYITGYVSSASGIATAGAHQAAFGDYRDAFLAKFSPSGNRLWATYIGGHGEDRGYGVCVDITGNVIVSGFTNSRNNIASKGAYHSVIGGDDDIFIARFLPSGKLLWSTYYGGPGKDRANAVCTDAAGKIYVTGITASRTNLSMAGVYQQGFKGNTNDAFLLRFSSTGTCDWCTYFGGYSEAHTVIADHAGNIYIAGDTYDPADIASPGAFQVKHGGKNDAFIAKFNSSGQRTWSSYFGGDGDDFGYGLAADDSDHVFLSGRSSTGSGLADTSAYQSKNKGSNDVFLVKFTAKGEKIWSTYYGGRGDDVGYWMTTDHYGNVFVTGASSSDSGMVTKGAYQDDNRGNNDIFIAKFGHRYINDGGIYRFLAPGAGVCSGKYALIAELKNFGSHSIDSVKIDWSINRQMQPGYYWKGKLKPDSTTLIHLGIFQFTPGFDTIKAWTNRPDGLKDSVVINDTADQIITVFSLPKANAGPDTTLCFDQAYTMQGAGGITYQWIPAKHLSSANDPNAKAILENMQYYTLIVTNQHGCRDTSDVWLKVRPRLKVKAFGPLKACYGQPVLLSAKGTGGDSMHYDYNWINDSSKGTLILVRLHKTGWHKVILSDQCSPANDTDSIFIRIIPPADASFRYSPDNYVKIYHKVAFENTSKNASGYLWNFDTNNTSKDSSTKISPQYIYKDTGNFRVRLIAYGLEGCKNDTAYQYIEIIEGKIKIYVPDAFTPDNNGRNDRFEIKGDGIICYSYKIYNRWGEMVFSSSDLTIPHNPGLSNLPWDGTFKGLPASESIYLYMLDVIDIDGDHHYLKGSLQLLR